MSTPFFLSIGTLPFALLQCLLHEGPAALLHRLEVDTPPQRPQLRRDDGDGHVLQVNIIFSEKHRHSYTRLFAVDLFTLEDQRKVAHLKITRSALSYETDKAANSSCITRALHNPTASDTYREFLETEGRVSAEMVGGFLGGGFVARARCSEEEDAVLDDRGTRGR